MAKQHALNLITTTLLEQWKLINLSHTSDLTTIFHLICLYLWKTLKKIKCLAPTKFSTTLDLLFYVISHGSVKYLPSSTQGLRTRNMGNSDEAERK